MLKSSGTFLKKPQENQALNHKQKQQDHSVPAFPNHLRTSALSSTLPHSCLPPPQTGRTTQTPIVPSSPNAATLQTPAVRSGPLFKTSSTLPDSHQGSIDTAPTDNKIKLDLNHAFDKKVAPAVSRMAPSRDDIHGQLIKVRSVAMRQQAPCLQKFNRLMDQHKGRYQDLNPHLGLDWSEDSEEEDGDLEKLVSYQCQRLQEKHFEESARSSRAERLAGFCSYLKQKHTHLCREQRGFRRERRSQHALRKALLQAAREEPQHTAQLIQEQHNETSTPSSTAVPMAGDDSGLCLAIVKGEDCRNSALPFTRHCFQHILQNRSQQLFSSCTARFADGAQCSIPVFDITHQTPLCDEHAKKMDNFLRGDISRRTYHHHQQIQRHRPLKKAKPPALSKKHKKKGKRGAPKRPQKPIPPALPQGNLGMPSILCLPTQPSGIRSPLTPDLSADEFPDDITNDISDIPHDLELNQEDFSDVLPRLPDDLQDFDLFEGKNSELLPTSEEAEELVRVLQAMSSYPESLACLSGMAELGPVEGVDCRSMSGGVVDLLSARLSAETLSSLELDPSLLPTSEDAFPPSPPSPQPPLTPPSSVGHLTDSTYTQRQPHLLAKMVNSKADLSDLPLCKDEDISHGSWGVLALPLSDSSQFHSLIASDGLLMSTALSTPMTPVPSAPCQPSSALSALHQSSQTVTRSTPASSPSSPTSQTKHLLPPLFNHCGIPADFQPHHSTTAPPMDQA